jgi:hypothetical protein
MTTSTQTDQRAGDGGGRYGQVNVFQAETTGLPVPPENLSVADERLLRKRELAATFRLFDAFGFSEGVAGQQESDRTRK